MSLFKANKKLLIGVVHLLPLPGSPRWEGDLPQVIHSAVRDADAYAKGGADAVFIENFGDVPFTKGHVGQETVAAMAAAGRAIRAAIKLPIGFNVLRNDACAALALCAACGGAFIRVNVHCGAMVTDQGIIEGNAFETLRYKTRIAPTAEIFADVHVKHAVPLGNSSIADSARDTLARGMADALIISGAGTGLPADLGALKIVRAACPTSRILLGSGVTAENVATYGEFADGFIVGTSLKAKADVASPVDARRVTALVKAVRALR